MAGASGKRGGSRINLVPHTANNTRCQQPLPDDALLRCSIGFDIKGHCRQLSTDLIRIKHDAVGHHFVKYHVRLFQVKHDIQLAHTGLSFWNGVVNAMMLAEEGPQRQLFIYLSKYLSIVSTRQ